MKKALTLSLAILLALTAMAQVPISMAQAIPKGPWLDEIVYFMELDEAKILKMIEKGDAHIWLWPLKTIEGKKYAEVSPEIELIDANPGCFNWKLNPVDTVPYTGELNIFSIREVREALNWLLDRDFIVKEIMGGFAIPHFTVFPPGALTT